MNKRLSTALFAFLASLLVVAGASQSAANTNPPAPATGDVLIDGELFSDIPWHQKLSTNDSNLIDVPFVLPYEAIPKGLAECPDKPIEETTTMEQARCMLRHGIVNVMAFRRTDTLYTPDDEAPAGQDCTDGTCVELRIEIQRLNTQTDAPYQADIVSNDGNQPTGVGPSFGFAVTEATIFAPWRPWYMGHYCGYNAPNGVIDSVCYDSYFTTQLQAFTNLGNQTWPRDRAALFFPQNPSNAPTGNYCVRGEDKCTMYLGKVDWATTAAGPNVEGCDVDAANCNPTALLQEVENKTTRLDVNFTAALGDFKDLGRFPWGGETNSGDATLPGVPYLGYYDLNLSEKKPVNEISGNLFQATHYTLPRKCTKPDFASARRGEASGIEKLKDCAVNFEIHSAGFFEQWKHIYDEGTPKSEIVNEVRKALTGGIANNQYGRTMFLLAGVPEQKIAVPFFAQDEDGHDYISGLSLYDQIYGSSLFTQYLPMVNPGDDNRKVMQYYGDNFWHAFFMSNHMNQPPYHFIDGIRGRTLWHNEFRSNLMYQGFYEGKTKGTRFEALLGHRDFPAGFQPGDHEVPYHGNTCDSCHIRNGSGIPLAPNGQLPNIHTDRGLNPGFFVRGDYTYTNGVARQGEGTNAGYVPSMKMVLFDLHERSPRRRQTQACDANDHTAPESAAHPDERYYYNKIMNYYGNSFHVNLKDSRPTYQLAYVDIETDPDKRSDANGRLDYEIVDTSARERKTAEGEVRYKPKRVEVSGFDIGPDRCTPDSINLFAPLDHDWPTSCDDVSGSAIQEALNTGEVGFMHLLGKRLGNTPLIEMIPNQAIVDAAKAQETSLGYAGCYPLAPGTRPSLTSDNVYYRSCETGKLGDSSEDCYIGRWGWIGDRASLEDQVANAAHVEQNISSKASYEAIHPFAERVSELVRYAEPLCGPADLGCQTSTTNSDITEEEIQHMASYQRWIGIPQRSEFQVSSAKVQRGEKVFRDQGCNHCHIIDKVPFVEGDNMLPDEVRGGLKDLEIVEGGKTDYPFVSYLGTDLLMHDMGYLSQVAKAPAGESLRLDSGEIAPGNLAYFQFIRTPPLKGLRFNRFVTDSHHQARDSALNGPVELEARAGCDFLLHDGRACDAIEAAFLHDGPAVKEIGMIEGLSKLGLDELDDLRAFLYSL